jgi:DNA polymerase III delta prime subunit
LFEHLKKICNLEGISYDEKALSKIIEVSRGDIRKSINLVQQNVKDNKLMSDITLESNIKDIFDKIRAKKFDEVRLEFIERNVDYDQLIADVYRYVVEDKTIPLETRKKIVLEIAQTLYEMSFVLIKEIPFAKFLIKLEGILAV